MALDPNYEMTPMDKLLANACPQFQSWKPETPHIKTYRIEACCVNWEITAKLVDRYINNENPKNHKYKYEVISMEIVE